MLKSECEQAFGQGAQLCVFVYVFGGRAGGVRTFAGAGDGVVSNAVAKQRVEHGFLLLGQVVGESLALPGLRGFPTAAGGFPGGSPARHVHRPGFLRLRHRRRRRFYSQKNTRIKYLLLQIKT